MSKKWGPCHPERLSQSQKIVAFGKTLHGEIVFAGDFNLLPETESFKAITRELKLQNLNAAFDVTSTRTSLYEKPIKCADYVLTSPGISVLDYQVLPDEVSDHAALMLDFEIPQTASLFAQLQREVDYAEASVTGKRVACIITTDVGEEFAGHNTEEQNPTTFHHAEHSALAQMIRIQPDAKIARLTLTGSGRAKKFKHVVPCMSCWEKLMPFFKNTSKIVLLLPHTFDRVITFPALQLQALYTPLSPSVIAAKTELELEYTLLQNTRLNARDARYVAQVAEHVQQLGGRCFLTGSSSGRGGIHEFLLSLTGDEYGDIDLIVTGEHLSIRSVEEVIFPLFVRTYGCSTIERRNVFIIGTTEQRFISRFLSADGSAIMDLTIGPSIDIAMMRKEYLRYQWFHEVIYERS